MFGELTIFQFILPLNLTWFLKLKKLIYLLWTPGFQNSSSLDYNVSIWSQRFIVVGYTKIFGNLVNIKIIIRKPSQINPTQLDQNYLSWGPNPTQLDPNLSRWVPTWPKIGFSWVYLVHYRVEYKLEFFLRSDQSYPSFISTQRPQPYLIFWMSQPG